MAREFVIKRRVQFAETDMAGVLHFANFYRLMEEVEHAFWRSTGLSVMWEIDGRVIGWPRVATSCEYFEPVRFEEEVELALKVASLSERSVSYEVEFRQQDRRVALGKTTAVCCITGAGRFKPTRIPDEFRGKLVEMVDSA